MIIFAFDDDEIWRDEIKEACEARGVTANVFCHPDKVEIEQILSAAAVICDNKFATSGFLGVNFICNLSALGYGGISILYTNHPRTVDTTKIPSEAWVITKDKSFDAVLDIILAKYRKDD